MPKWSKHLKTTHKTTHRLFHRLTRRLVHGQRGPNYAQEAVTAYNRFIRLHRRLMKLVPEVFDYGIEMHLRKQKEDDEKQMELFEPALEKIYGPPAPRKLHREFWMDGAEMVQKRCNIPLIISPPPNAAKWMRYTRNATCG